MRFVENRNLRRDLDRSAQGRRVLERAAEDIAQAATPIGRQVASSYEAGVVVEGTTVRVKARTRGIDASAWIEFGTALLPPAAPLRKGVQRAGLKLR